MICNNCRSIFNIDEAAIVDRNYAGIILHEKKCPECGGSFRAIELPSDLDSYLFVDNDKRYYSYKSKGES